MALCVIAPAYVAPVLARGDMFDMCGEHHHAHYADGRRKCSLRRKDGPAGNESYCASASALRGSRLASSQLPTPGEDGQPLRISGGDIRPHLCKDLQRRPRCDRDDRQSALRGSARRVRSRRIGERATTDGTSLSSRSPGRFCRSRAGSRSGGGWPMQQPSRRSRLGGAWDSHCGIDGRQFRVV